MSRPKRLPTSLLKRQFKALRSVARNDRDRLILSIGFYAGLRVAEICALRVEHIDLGQGFLTVFNGKGGRDRRVPLHKKLSRRLGQWLGVRAEGWLLPGRRADTHLTVRAVQWVIEGCVRRAGLVPVDGRRKPTIRRPTIP